MSPSGVATSFFQMKSFTVVPDALAENLHNHFAFQGLLHTNLQGVAPKDVTFITNEFMNIATVNVRGSMFKVDNLPEDFSNPTLKARWQFVNCSMPFARTSNFEISLHQGNTVHDPIVELDLSGQIASLGFSCNVWNDLILPINAALITDPTDLYIRVYMDRLPLSSVLVDERVSWLVIEADFPFGAVETPTFKNYVNSLTKINNISIRTVGTPGTSRYCYRVLPCDSAGICGPASDEVVIETGNANLDATNFICLTWFDDVGATNYKIYKTCAPLDKGLGLIATVALDQGDCGTGGGGFGVTGYGDKVSGCL